MNCKTCGYALWNLRTHVCPECGEAFRIEDFEFVPASVRYCCPHCNQGYYGIDTRGHLVPRAFDCVKCGQRVTMEEMVVVPAEGVKDRETAQATVPWIDRTSGGFFSRWFRTIGWGFARGSDIGRGLTEESRASSAVGYLLLNLVVSLLATFVPLIVFMMLMMRSVMGTGGPGGGGAGPGGAAGTMMFSAAFSGVMVFVGGVLAVGAIVMVLGSHVVLAVSGGAPGGLKKTTECVSYASGPLLMGGVPCVGLYLYFVSWVWWTVSAAMALRRAHGVSTMRGVIAALVPGLLYPALLVGGYAAFILSIMTMSRTAPPAAIAGAQSSGSRVASLAMAWRVTTTQSRSAGPIHASELLNTGFVTGDSFLSESGVSTPADVPVGPLTLADFSQQVLSFSPAQSAAVQAASAALPAGTIAHRVGDYVFTYHGIDLPTAPQSLWVVIENPVPGPASAAPVYYAVGKVSGSSEVIDVSNFGEALATQNQLRVSCGLAPLPMPETVTADQPAVGPGQ